MKLKMFEEFIDDDLDYEEEYDDKYLFVGWKCPKNSHLHKEDSYKNHWNEHDWVYIIQETIDKENIIFYKDYPYNVKKMMGESNNIEDYYDILSNEDMEEWIYSNKKTINVYSREGGATHVYYKDLPDEVKNNY